MFSGNHTSFTISNEKLLLIFWFHVRLFSKNVGDISDLRNLKYFSETDKPHLMLIKRIHLYLNANDLFGKNILICFLERKSNKESFENNTLHLLKISLLSWLHLSGFQENSLIDLNKKGKDATRSFKWWR